MRSLRTFVDQLAPFPILWATEGHCPNIIRRERDVATICEAYATSFKRVHTTSNAK